MLPSQSTHHVRKAPINGQVVVLGSAMHGAVSRSSTSFVLSTWWSWPSIFEIADRLPRNCSRRFIPYTLRQDGQRCAPSILVQASPRERVHLLGYISYSLWVNFLSDTYPDVSWCILEVYTYPDASPKKESPKYNWDTCQIHQDTCILRASLVSHWIHIKIHQDTYISVSSSPITIHQEDTPRYKIMIHVSWTRHDLSWWHIKIQSGYITIHASWTLTIHVSQMYPERYVSEMQDTCGIHARYKMYLQG